MPKKMGSVLQQPIGNGKKYRNKGLVLDSSKDISVVIREKAELMQFDDRCGMWISLSVVSVIEKGSKVITYEQREGEMSGLWSTEKKG